MVRGVGCFQDTHQFQTVVVYGDSSVESVTLMFLLTNTDIMGTWSKVMDEAVMLIVFCKLKIFYLQLCLQRVTGQQF